MKSLIIIPARGGSKGIPRKNIKLLNGKPLIGYTIDVARQIVNDEDICVSTDDDEIIDVVEKMGLYVPFKRPDYLATDTSGSYEVLLHAVQFYENIGRKYDVIILLQPTSPFRTVDDVRSAIALYTTEIDMVVSVKIATTNPYYGCYEEDECGFLKHSKGNGQYTRRQDAPKAYEYNGAVYVINVDSLKTFPMSKFKRKKKYVMDDIHSLDLDTMFDWKMAELLLQENLVEV